MVELQMVEHSLIFIDGAWVESSGRDTIDVVNPATEELFARVPNGTAEDVDRAARAASKAFETWSRSTPAERAAVLNAIAGLLEDRTEEIARMIVSEVGEPFATATRSQVGAAVAQLRIIIRSLPELAWDEQVDSTVIHRAPAGVVGAITPWNSPLVTICMKAGAAIAAGCTVVMKGSEVAPLSSFLFAELAAEAGLPPGVLNLVCGTGPEVGEAIAAHPAIDMVSLTGSVHAGRRVMALAAHSIKRVALELGGKSANVILEDADLARAVVDGVEDAFRNSGQVCGGLTRMLVHQDRLAEAEELAARRAESYVLGDPLEPTTTLGPVTTAAQRDRVRGYIRSGVEDGARLLTGGPEAPDHLEHGYFVRPTVFSGDTSARIAREEIFGPVLTIIPFVDEADAIAIANDTMYGLAGAVWAGDDRRARAVAKQLRTGRVRINGSAVNPRAPFGGFKSSGIGREWGRFGVEEFLEYQSIG